MNVRVTYNLIIECKFSLVNFQWYFKGTLLYQEFSGHLAIQLVGKLATLGMLRAAELLECFECGDHLVVFLWLLLRGFDYSRGRLRLL
jgi:hypothetical protein